MDFLQKNAKQKQLKKIVVPKNEKAFLLLPIGYPATDCKVPNISKKELKDISSWH